MRSHQSISFMDYLAFDINTLQQYNFYGHLILIFTLKVVFLIFHEWLNMGTLDKFAGEVTQHQWLFPLSKNFMIV